METIIDYKVKDFFQLTDYRLIAEYEVILHLLKPLKVIDNPNYNKYKFWDKNTSKTIQITDRNSFTFGERNELADYFNEGNFESVIEGMKLVTGLSEKQIFDFTITKFYGIINHIQKELIDISNMEIDALSDDSFDINLESVNAKGRMAKFGVLNIIDSLAKEDVTKWIEIEKLPYMTVFSKLLMDKEKANIQKELDEIQKRKNKQKQ
ncbi:hypothetical protein LZZ90_08330 [Flavobacterium sp. SM15]|uniref:hypothetical protein n=1 Tax=Flavobacterium sp. SM15 TaxID=2908005 RepID=UPI001EDB1557|nr:hypothetical protein [Flavobacterium sp. SM15]MCG2611513.1 hypothetical protein [Flavobacterium sp. SM15]